MLFDRGADLKALEAHKPDILQHLVERGQEGSVEMLVKYGANVNKQGGLYGNALQMAPRYKKTKTAAILLVGGANVNSRDRCDHTALICAILRQNKKISRILVDSQADPAFVDGYGRTAIDWLKLRRTDDDLLQSLCPEFNLPADWDVSRLRSTIVSLSLSLLENAEVYPDDLRSDYYIELKRCLSMSIDHKNASFAFKMWTAIGKSDMMTMNNDYCSMCMTEFWFDGTHFVCTVCPDIRLCSGCMEAHNKEKSVTTCRDHFFLCLTPVESADYSEEGEKMWLRTLMEKYSDS